MGGGREQWGVRPGLRGESTEGGVGERESGISERVSCGENADSHTPARKNRCGVKYRLGPLRQKEQCSSRVEV